MAGSGVHGVERSNKIKCKEEEIVLNEDEKKKIRRRGFGEGGKKFT